MLDGRALATQLRDDLRQRVERLAADAAGAPRLAILGDGANEGAVLYAASLDRAASRVGIGTDLRLGPQGSLERAIEQLNADRTVAGIVIAQPFADPVEGRRLVLSGHPEQRLDLTVHARQLSG